MGTWIIIGRLACDLVKKELAELYHPMINTVQDSASRMTESTTQYISHGASCEGSEERRAL